MPGHRAQGRRRRVAARATCPCSPARPRACWRSASPAARPRPRRPPRRRGPGARPRRGTAPLREPPPRVRRASRTTGTPRATDNRDAYLLASVRRKLNITMKTTLPPLWRRARRVERAAARRPRRRFERRVLSRAAAEAAFDETGATALGLRARADAAVDVGAAEVSGSAGDVTPSRRPVRPPSRSSGTLAGFEFAVEAAGFEFAVEAAGDAFAGASPTR